MSLILLRDLPGIETLEYRFEQHGGWSDLLEEEVRDLAEELFGISEYDIDDDWDDDEHFPQLKHMRDESDAYWASHGWDVTDGNGKQLAVMDILLRPMVCLVERKHPEATFSGGTEAWASQLEADAKTFRPSR